MECMSSKFLKLADAVGELSARRDAMMKFKTKSEAEYEPVANGDNECRRCLHFHSPNGCWVVSGDIRSGGWCKFFEA
jgi:hypothetical protein